MTAWTWIFNIIVVVGTGYVVFFLDYSGWWWLLAVGLLFTPDRKDK